MTQLWSGSKQELHPSRSHSKTKDKWTLVTKQWNEMQTLYKKYSTHSALHLPYINICCKFALKNKYIFLEMYVAFSALKKGIENNGFVSGPPPQV